MVCKVHSMSVNSSMMQGVMHIEPIVSRNSISIIMNYYTDHVLDVGRYPMDMRVCI